mgnify:CR=1 FL=1
MSTERRQRRESSSAVALVGSKASPAEADAYKRMLVGIAQKAAEASKEGGFLGIDLASRPDAGARSR